MPPQKNKNKLLYKKMDLKNNNMHNENIDEVCWCEVCESYRQRYNYAKHSSWILTGIVIAIVLLAFINAGMTEQFYLTHTL